MPSQVCHRLPGIAFAALVLLVALTAGGVPDAHSTGHVQGDADCSGGVGSPDAVDILGHSASVEAAGCADAADTNCDNHIDARDALNVLFFLSDIDAVTPAFCSALGAELGDVTVAVDTSLEPNNDPVEGLNGGPPQAVEVAIDPDGVRLEYVADEMVYKPADDDDLQAFLDKYNGTVLRGGTVSVPAGLPNAGAEVDHGYYIIKVDPSGTDLSNLADYLAQSGMSGKATFSSVEAAALMAIAADDAEGRTFVSGLLSSDSTQEHPKPTGGFLDAETFWYFQSGDGTANIGVTEAWRYMRYQAVPKVGEFSPLGPPVFLAIIDSGGFALNTETGVPLNGNIDYYPPAAKPLQANAITLTSNAGGCSDDPCSWHGTSSFGACCAIPDNQYGTAGSAGRYVVPVLIKIDGRIPTAAQAIRIADAADFDIFSMSFGYECGSWCGWSDGDIGDATDDAGLDGHILLAAAGPSAGTPYDIGGDTHMRPCEFPKVICVGSITPAGNNALNWGSPVDMWGPNEVTTTINPNITYPATFQGTSAATPFVAGVVALIRSLDPNLNYTQVRQLLQNTANVPSDPKVAHGYVNALQAVLAVRPNQPPLILDVEPPVSKQTYPYSGRTFRVVADDPEPGADQFEFDGFSLAEFRANGQILCGTNTVKFRDGVPGYECTVIDAPIGTFDVEVTVTDPFFAQAQATINEVTFVNTPPTVQILGPTDGATFYATQSIEFDAYVFDPEENIPFPQDDIVWTSDIDGVIGTGNSIETTLSQGVHTITITATDSKGASTQESIELNVLSGAGVPTVGITSPAEDPSFHGPGEQITFIGQASDPEDGALTGASLQWYSNIDGFLGTGTQITTTLSGGSNCDDYRDHIITLQATDSDNHVVTDQIHVVVAIFC